MQTIDLRANEKRAVSSKGQALNKEIGSSGHGQQFYSLPEIYRGPVYREQRSLMCDNCIKIHRN